MTKAQIKYGPWNIKNGFIPPKVSITYFENYRHSDKLSLFITQTNLTSYQQKKNIEIWCKKLPYLHEIKFLWLPSKVNQKIFDSICQMTNLEGVWIKWSGIKNLDNLIKLDKLKHLKLGSSSQVESIEILGKMTKLETLELEQLNKVSDFSVISRLKQLEGLGIDGSMWTAQKIDTLEPLRSLKKLKYFTMTNSRVKDKSFDPLLDLTNLIRFNCSWNYPESEFEKLKSLPKLKHGNVETSWKKLKAKFGIK
ncbi:leucine-rich repeat domain-containing protein [Seonamhaeicola maritimus]|uniref:Leucine-rich repeat domain-containing protein n=1 Tax=Seonamhaeicola maritimus TaxID=2591822 RepID=A0A5C7GF80_9FLAO|nr:hypothetical protein [Seonamhaeicola maritimus]TXG35623.1 hypothetical protein FUA22_14045 [Seonamhaeicola maritimus]